MSKDEIAYEAAPWILPDLAHRVEWLLINNRKDEAIFLWRIEMGGTLEQAKQIIEDWSFA